VRSLIDAFPSDDGEAEPSGSVWSFVSGADAMTVYQLVALSAATIRWASHETGRTEHEILDELEQNFAG